VWRSRDGGQHWELRSPLVSAQLVSALHISPDSPDVVYLSQGIPQSRSTLRVSSDGAATFANYEQDRALTLLHVEPGSPARLWVVGRDAQSVANRGFAISRGDGPAGPWVSKLRVNYFGGFVLDERGTLTVGDESGGLFRSLDGGETFRNVSAKSAVSCLSRAGDATWACNIGTTVEPALTRLVDTAEAPTQVVAFADVTQLVSCAPELAVERRCAQAWLEWQRDVLMRDLSGKDAGGSAVVDSGTAGPSLPDASVDGAAQAPRDAGQVDGSQAQPVAASRAHDGCSVSRDGADAHGARSRSAVWLWLGSITLVLRGRTRRRRWLSRSLPPA
jgi:hypothetical protein